MVYQARFDRAFDIIIGHEGGYVLDPKDRGGETKWGISKRQYPMLDIPSLTKLDAKHIYHRDYWSACRCGDLPWPMALMVFDAAVNQGPKTARKILQKSLGVVRDGIIGPQTLAAVSRADPEEISKAMAVERLLRYIETATFHRFGRGWFRRVLETYRATIED